MRRRREERACVAREADPVGDSEDPSADEGERERGGRTRGRVAVCQLYGSTLSYTNMARHQRTYRVWYSGSGSSP